MAAEREGVAGFGLPVREDLVNGLAVTREEQQILAHGPERVAGEDVGGERRFVGLILPGELQLPISLEEGEAVLFVGGLVIVLDVIIPVPAGEIVVAHAGKLEFQHIDHFSF